VNFHFAEGKITAGSRTYYKAPNVPIEVILSDPNGKKPKKSILDDELCAFFQMEKDCYTAVRHSEIETQDILKNRKREESTIILETNLFEDATNDQNTKKKKKEEEKNNEKDVSHKILLSSSIYIYIIYVCVYLLCI
jgi:hypothetical protein